MSKVVGELKIVKVEGGVGLIRVWVIVDEREFCRISTYSWGDVRSIWRNDNHPEYGDAPLSNKENEQMESIFKAYCLSKKLDPNSISELRLLNHAK